MSAITTSTLACGMPLIVESNPGVRSAALCWLLPVGSGCDPEDKQGLATMLSELIFRGAGGLASREQADALDRLGLSRGSEVGGFYLRLSATMLADRLLDALPLMADIVLRPRIDEESIEPVRDLSLQALAGLKDQPQERASILLTARHARPPLNRSGMGSPEGLERITRDDLLSQWRQRVLPQGSILAVSGAVDHAAIARSLDQQLAGWSGRTPQVVWTESPTRGSYHHEPDQTSQVQIFLAHDAPAEASPDARLERVVSSVLSGGSSSRLFTEVRERRALCYSVSASYGAEKSWGRVTGYVGTTPDKAQQSLDVMLAELHRIQSPGGAVSAEEFQRALVGLKSRLVFSGESTSARAASLALDQHRLGRPRELAEVAAEAAGVTLDDVNAYLGRRSMGPITIVTLGPTALRVPA